MFKVEKMTPKTFPFAVELANTMDWGMGEADFAFNLKMEPNGCFLLKDDSKPVGIATCISYGRVGWFGNLVVAESHRKRGAGTMLLNHAVDYLKSVGVATVGLYAYPHLVDFYGDVGFKRDVAFDVLKGDRVLASPMSEGNVCAKEMSNRDLAVAVELDAVCFGDKRERLMQIIFANKRNVCRISEQNGETVGFAMSKVYGGSAEVGPLACKNGHADVSVALLSSVLNRLEGLDASLYMPSNEAALLDAAGKFGFKKSFGLVRMFLGAPVQTDCIYIAESLERG